MRRVRFGYNHRIIHAGRVYDVQSEDSGSTKKRIFTHVFHDGVIVASRRVDYDESTDSLVIAALMKESHKSMVRALVNGGLDHAITCNCGEAPPAQTPPEAEASTEVPVPAANGGPPLAAASEAFDFAQVQGRLDELADEVRGTLVVALVELERGSCLASVGTGLDVDAVAAGYREVVQAQLAVMHALGVGGGLDDMLVTLDTQLHLVRIVDESRFLVLVVDREQGNLALARRGLAKATELLVAP